MAETEGLPGSFGTSSSLAIRLGQIVFSTASLLFMCLDVDFYSYTVFSNFVVVMGILIPWSLTMAMVDAWSVFTDCAPRRRRRKTVFMIIVGDMFLSYILLAAAASTAGVTDAMIKAGGFCSPKLCSRYQLSAAMAFLCWFLLISSSLFNLWQLPSL
uniref:CASP-like protein n=1 Tax=Kalanchoe fedtschenkoi TaxID=63787 RepID=A0A7N0RBU7_KALFE